MDEILAPEGTVSRQGSTLRGAGCSKIHPVGRVEAGSCKWRKPLRLDLAIPAAVLPVLLLPLAATSASGQGAFFPVVTVAGCDAPSMAALGVFATVADCYGDTSGNPGLGVTSTGFDGQHGGGAGWGGASGGGAGGGGLWLRISNAFDYVQYNGGPAAFSLLSMGGRGGHGGDGNIIHDGASGGQGGDGGSVIFMLEPSGSIETGTMGTIGILAVSKGGQGGDGGEGHGASDGGTGGLGGNGGSVSVITSAGSSISTAGNYAAAVSALSEGGYGGAGGSGGFFFGRGGSGGQAGNSGSSVSVGNSGTLSTLGVMSHGALARSVGGNGGEGGVTTGTILVLGGNGGAGGNGERVAMMNLGRITTAGDHARGLSGLSIGGGGGDGGQAFDYSSFYGVAIGGNAGGGGDAGMVTIDNSGTILTAGRYATGMVGRSIGGGGGEGGSAQSVVLGYQAAVSLTMGGLGGSGGDGGMVTLTSSGRVATGYIDPLDAVEPRNVQLPGDHAAGMLAQSVGGGGGNGGAVISVTAAASGSGAVDVSVALGGSGGSGGDGSDAAVFVLSGGSVVTYGRLAPAVYAQSVGGGGGTGGHAIGVGAAVGEAAVSLSAVVGGTGGSGGNGGTASVYNEGSAATASSRSPAVFAQSVGGGGGSGGSVVAVDTDIGKNALSLNVALGMTGGSGGQGGAANATTSISSTIQTLGHQSHGLLAQSVGGGGGHGGDVHTYAISAIYGNGHAVAVPIAVGGHGGSGGTGGSVTVSHAGSILTFGDQAHGLFGQSVGGGGGDGGSVLALSIAATLDSQSGENKDKGGRAVSTAVAVGGHGGVGNHGGSVVVNAAAGSTIATSGVMATGVKLQSVGGGGGTGGVAHSFAVSTSVPSWNRFYPPQPLLLRLVNKVRGLPSRETDKKNGADIAVSVGGWGGAGGNGGSVTFTAGPGATVTTSGVMAYGVHGQSVGGGGGSGGHAISNGFIGFDTYALGVSVGGSGSSAGDGGSVSLAGSAAGPETSWSLISTQGANAHGLFAQSIGGGGGDGGAAASAIKSIPVLSGQGFEMAIGGASGSSGAGGSVLVSNPGRVQTAGAGAHGIFAQSVGGGGGYGGDTTAGGLMKLAIGRAGSGGGSGGSVAVEGQGAIVTLGAGAAGIFAQSVGGGGGAGSLAHEGSLPFLPDTNYGLALTIGGGGGNGGWGGDVSVNFGGGIGTYGAAAPGILAQSIGGSGGALGVVRGTIAGGAFPVTVTSSGAFGFAGHVSIDDTQAPAPLLVETRGGGSAGIIAHVASGGGGLVLMDTAVLPLDITADPALPSSLPLEFGGIDVNLRGGIYTVGASAYGILAMDLPQTVVLLGTDGLRIPQSATSSGSGTGINIWLRSTSTVSTWGPGAHGIYVVSNADYNGSTALTARLDGMLAVQGAGAWAVNISDGLTSGSTALGQVAHLSIGRTGTVSAAKGTAGGIRVGAQVSNLMLDVEGALRAPGGTALWSGAGGALNVRSGGILEGDISGPASRDLGIGNAGVIFGSILNGGSYTIVDGGKHFLALDPAGLASDRIDLLSLETGRDQIIPQLTAFAPAFAQPSTVLSFAGASDTSPIVQSPGEPLPFGFASGTVATRFVYDFYHDRALVTGASVDFGRAGLSGNSGKAATFANDMVTALGSNVPGAYPELEALLLSAANAVDPKALESSLAVFDAADFSKASETTLASSGTHLSNMQSCGGTVGPYAAIAEEACNWAKVTGSTTRYDWSSDVDTVMVSLGRQQRVSDDLVIGLSTAYEGSRFRASGRSASGYRLYLGAIAKVSQGPVYGSVSLNGSYGSGKAERLISSGGTAYVARSRPSTLALASRLRAGVLAKAGQIDVIPSVELDLAVLQDGGFTESGAGSLNLKVHRATHFLADVRPVLRLSTDHPFAGGIVRGYVEAGARIALNGLQHTVSLPGSPAPGERLRLELKRDPAVATLGLGGSLLWGSNMEARMQYEATAGRNTLGHSASLKLGLKF